MSWREELYHHGVKGMRWGVRRYQNKDGTLTAKGKKHLNKLYNKDKATKQAFERKAEHTRQSLESSGVKIGDEYDVIPKGTSIGRFSSHDEGIDSKRKYAFVTHEDEESYAFWIKTGQLLTDSADKYQLYMDAKKDIKVAKGKEVVDYLLASMESGVGSDNETLKQMKAFIDANEIAPGLRQMDTSKLSNKDKQFVQYLDNGRKIYRKINTAAIAKDSPVSDAVFNHFKSKGYDAIVDMEDVLGGVEYPIILLNPKESVTLKDRIKYT